jgi:hypothetical protein
LTTRIPVDRERVVRTLTFWLRPAFVLRVLNRFQVIAGFDRAMALASSTLTALIPLAILAGAVLPHVQAESSAQWLIDRYALTGGGAEAVRDALAPSTATNTDVGVIGALLLVIAVLSFARGMQRLFEQCVPDALNGPGGRTRRTLSANSGPSDAERRSEGARPVRRNRSSLRAGCISRSAEMIFSRQRCAIGGRLSQRRLKWSGLCAFWGRTRLLWAAWAHAKASPTAVPPLM